MAVFVAFVHHLAAFVLFAAIFMELVLVKGELTAWSARKILLYDLIYGIAAALLVVAGTFRALSFEKGAHYYLHSIPFLVKIATFALVGLLSIYPTRRFFGWRPLLKLGETPVLDPAERKRIASIIHIELTGVAVILLCAAMMAKGVGYFG